MRKVRRTSPAPLALSARTRKTTEFERAERHYVPYSPATAMFKFKVYKADEVHQRLEELFHGKCAYCESYYSSVAPVDVEHYRPKGRVEQDAGHPGYWWLGMAWENLLPSCIDCNRRRRQLSPTPNTSLAMLDLQARGGGGFAVVQSGKQDAFPIRGVQRAQTPTCDLDAEDPLLLDPCRDDPAEHLDFHTERPYLVALALPAANPMEPQGLSERGAVSIQVYGLNRLALVQERTRVLRRLDFLGGMIADLSKLADEAETEAGAFNLRIAKRLRRMASATLGEIRGMAAASAPYSTLTRHWIKHFRARLLTP